MLKSSLVLISIPEANLIDTIQALQYGELYGVEVEAEDPLQYGSPLARPLSPAMEDLIHYIRAGTQHIDILTVHAGQPVIAETDFKMNGFRCRKKVKFPTVHAEG